MDFEQMAEMDIAHHILTQKKMPMHYKELITEVIETKHKPVQSLSNANYQIYKMINNDTSF